MLLDHSYFLLVTDVLGEVALPYVLIFAFCRHIGQRLAHTTLFVRFWESDEYHAFVREHGPLQEEKIKPATRVPPTTTEPQSSQVAMTTATPTVTATTSTSSHSGNDTGPNTKYGVLPPISADGGGSNAK